MLQHVGASREDFEPDKHIIIAHAYKWLTTWIEMEVSEVASSGTGNVHGIIVGGQVSPVKVRSDLTSSILKDR